MQDPPGQAGSRRERWRRRSVARRAAKPGPGWPGRISAAEAKATCPAGRRLQYLDDHELLQAVTEVECPLNELALIEVYVVVADFHLVEPDLARYPPDEHVEEAAEPSAVCGSKTVEDLSGPAR